MLIPTLAASKADSVWEEGPLSLPPELPKKSYLGSSHMESKLIENYNVYLPLLIISYTILATFLFLYYL
jgi:hypothetical protein